MYHSQEILEKDYINQVEMPYSVVESQSTVIDCLDIDIENMRLQKTDRRATR